MAAPGCEGEKGGTRAAGRGEKGVAACGWAEVVGRARDGKRGGVLGRKGRGEGLGVFGPKQMEGDVPLFFLLFSFI